MNALTTNNTQVRLHLENFTKQYTLPYTIEFIRDVANSRWVTSLENLQNIRFLASRADLREYMQANSITLPQGVNSLKDILQNYCSIVDYTP